MAIGESTAKLKILVQYTYTIRYAYKSPNTVEPPNNGQVGVSTLVHYSEVVLYWGVLIKKPYIVLYVTLIYFIQGFKTYYYNQGQNNTVMYMYLVIQ